MSTGGLNYGDTNSDLNLSSLASLNQQKSVPYLNRFVSNKKIESMTSPTLSSDSFNSKIFSNSSNSFMESKTIGSSSFFKRSMSSNQTNTTITGKSSSIKRDVGIKLLDVQEQSANPREAKRKRKEQEKEIQKKLKQEEKEAKTAQQIAKSKSIEEKLDTADDKEQENAPNENESSSNISISYPNNVLKTENQIEQSNYNNNKTENSLQTFNTNPPQFYSNTNQHLFNQVPPQQMMMPISANQLPIPQISSLNELFNSRPNESAQVDQFRNNYFSSANFSSPLLTQNSQNINETTLTQSSLPTTSFASNSNTSSSFSQAQQQQQQTDVKRAQPSLTLTVGVF